MRLKVRSLFGILTVVFIFSLVSQVARAQLEITELMFNPNDESVWEWIEVRNTGGSAVDLNGYLGFNMNDAEPSSLNPTINGSLATNTTIGPGEVAVIYDGNQGGFMGFPSFDDSKFREAWNLDAGVPLIAADFWPTLSNSTGAPTQSVAFWPNATAYQMDVTPVEDDPEGEPGVFTNRVTSFANAAFSIDYSTGFPAVDGKGSITWSGNGSNQNGFHWSLSSADDAGVTTSVEVQVPGIINSTDDIGNPGIAPPGTPSTTGLHITEIMYDSGGSEPDWEWVEVYNSTASTIDLSGGVIDDGNGNAHSASNIASGSVPAGGTAILYNDVVSDADFRTAWGAGLNLIAVSNWTTQLMALNNGDDTVGVWADFSSYDGDNQTQANALVSQTYDESAGFPALSQGPSISLAHLSFDPSDGANWDNAVLGDTVGSFRASGVTGGGGTIVFHPGDDVGSPGTFTAVDPSADADGDGDVDGNDFLLLQRNDPESIPLWISQFGTSGVSSISAVPEPSTFVLLGLMMSLPAGRFRR